MNKWKIAFFIQIVLSIMIPVLAGQLNERLTKPQYRKEPSPEQLMMAQTIGVVFVLLITISFWFLCMWGCCGLEPAVFMVGSFALFVGVLVIPF